MFYYVRMAVVIFVPEDSTISMAVALPKRSYSVPYSAPRGDYRPYLGWPYVQPGYTGCPMSSAKESNAEQQNFPVNKYGQTSRGYGC